MVTVCGAASPFVHVTPWPVFAWIVAGVKANPFASALTAPAEVDTVQPPPAAPPEAPPDAAVLPDADSLAAPDPLPDAAVDALGDAAADAPVDAAADAPTDGLLVELQAASISTAAMPTAAPGSDRAMVMGISSSIASFARRTRLDPSSVLSPVRRPLRSARYAPAAHTVPAMARSVHITEDE